MSLFFDLSLPCLDSPGGAAAGRREARLQAAARALELGYSAVAYDRPHRGVLADADRCRVAPFPLAALPAASPLAASASFHRRRLGGPGGAAAAVEGFRQYTRVTVAVDSAAAAAAALAPSAALVLRSYDLVAARPLGQAAFDHLCRYAEVDIISIDFSQKLPFRLKLQLIELAIKRGLYFEIAYSPLIVDINSRRQMLAEAKLLIDWTKGKNLIISSAALTLREIRGPYDVTNLFVCLLGLSMERAKAAISINCRSLIAKALRKKHFYKETIRIERLSPNKQLNSEKFILGDWIGWDPISGEGDLPSLDTNLEPPVENDKTADSSAVDPSSVVQEKHLLNNNEPVYPSSKQLKQSAVAKEIPISASEEIVQDSRSHEVLKEFRLLTSPAYLDRQDTDKGTSSDESSDMEVCVAHLKQLGEPFSVNLENTDAYVEFDHDAMQIDPADSRKCIDDDAPISSDVDLACSLPQNMELSDVCLDVKGSDQSNDIPDDMEACRDYAKVTECAPSGRDEQAQLNPEIPLASDVCFEDKDPDWSNDIQDVVEAHGDGAELMECIRSGRDDQARLNHEIPLSVDLLEGDAQPEQVTQEKVEQAMRNEPDINGCKTSPKVSTAHAFHHAEDIFNLAVDDSNEGLIEATGKSKQVEERNCIETNSFLEKDTTEIDGQILNDSSANDGVESSTTKSGKRRQKLRSRRLSYLPFLGFLKPMPFKKKACKVRGPRKHL